MTDRKKLGWTENGIIGLVFAPMGALFAFLGLLFWQLRLGEDPEDPVIFLAVFGGMGLIFLAVGLIFLSLDLKRRQGAQRALDGGYYVMGTIAGVSRPSNTSKGSTYARRVEAHYQDENGVMHVYYSRYFSFDPSDMFKSDKVPIYLEQGGDGWYVDIDAVLPKVVQHK